MIQLEDRLTELLARVAEAVDVHPEVDRVLKPTPDAISLSTRRQRRRAPFVIAAAAAVMAVTLIVTVVATRGEDSDVEAGDPVVPAGDPHPDRSSDEGARDESADGPPRLLVTHDGWTLDHVDEMEETYVNDGAGAFQLARYEAERYEQYLTDRLDDGREVGSATLAGSEAVLIERDGADGSVYVALWRHGDYAFEARGDTFDSLDGFLAVATTLEEVTEDEWTSALPEGTVPET